jgi:hypothetical protein
MTHSCCLDVSFNSRNSNSNASTEGRRVSVNLFNSLGRMEYERLGSIMCPNTMKAQNQERSPMRDKGIAYLTSENAAIGMLPLMPSGSAFKCLLESVTCNI